MDQIRSDKFHQLIDLLEQVDSIQQALLGETKDVESYAIHEQLDNMIDNFIVLASDEDINIG